MAEQTNTPNLYSDEVPMLDRVAWALLQAMEKRGTIFVNDTFHDLASAAIAAMREPDRAMRDAALVAVSDITVCNPKATAWDAVRAYRAMIDASLSPTPASSS